MRRLQASEIPELALQQDLISSIVSLGEGQIVALHPILLDMLNAAIALRQAQKLTRRDAALPAISGKVHSVIGMRRTGKTTFLLQLLEARREQVPPERAIYVSFDDDRLANLEADQLDLLFEEYYRRYPEFRGRETVSWFLDEIQLVSGWDRFVRRVLDTERVEIVVSGSSAQMLSREVHTSLRGRGIATIIRPFSLREFLRHRGEEPSEEPSRWISAERSKIEKRFGEYLTTGGFPEAQSLQQTTRVELLQGYVDTVLFRDIVERYGVSQVAALRWLIRQCLRNPASLMSVHRFYQDLRAQGHGVGKDAVHELFGYLLDAFLITAVFLDTESERRRNSNPRKIYPLDPGLIGAFDSSGRSNIGHALETAVLNELERRKAQVGYVKSAEGFEVDFHVRYPAGEDELLQVCADPSSPAALERELRALIRTRTEYPHATPRLLVLNRDQAWTDVAPGVVVQPAYEWLLAAAEGNT